MNARHCEFLNDQREYREGLYVNFILIEYLIVKVSFRPKKLLPNFQKIKLNKRREGGV